LRVRAQRLQAASTTRLASGALAFNAFTWGLSWWPLRALEGQGLHPLWSTVVVYLLAAAVITAWRPRAWGQLLRTRSLWWLVLASGTTNASFNWGVTIGDVVRVVLLFYLMPLWAVLFARLVLKESPSLAALGRVALALVGAAIVLWPQAGGLPLPQTLAEWLGVLGGAAFALNNVLLKREAAQPDEARVLAMFLGGALIAGVLALVLGAQGRVPAPPPAAWPWMLGVLALGLWFLASNLALQYGAARLPAHTTAVVMVSEVLFAGVSAVLLGAAALSAPLLLGGGLIVLASVLAARRG
jgi:drug/metabolite transporter (DMT)-like permease